MDIYGPDGLFRTARKTAAKSTKQVTLGDHQKVSVKYVLWSRKKHIGIHWV